MRRERQIRKQVEEFRPIKGWEGLYEVSDLGNVRTCRKDRLLKPTLNGVGYPTVRLCRDGNPLQIYVHELVAQAFQGERPKGYDIDHINMDRADSRLSNLRYCTRQDNKLNQNPWRYYKTSEGLYRIDVTIPQTRKVDGVFRQFPERIKEDYETEAEAEDAVNRLVMVYGTDSSNERIREQEMGLSKPSVFVWVSESDNPSDRLTDPGTKQ